MQPSWHSLQFKASSEHTFICKSFLQANEISEIMLPTESVRTATSQLPLNIDPGPIHQVTSVLEQCFPPSSVGAAHSHREVLKLNYVENTPWICSYGRLLDPPYKHPKKHVWGIEWSGTSPHCPHRWPIFFVPITCVFSRHGTPTHHSWFSSVSSHSWFSTAVLLHLQQKPKTSGLGQNRNYSLPPWGRAHT